MLAFSAYAQTLTPISTTPRMQQSGHIDYVALGASFRTTNGNGTNPCQIKTGNGTIATGNAGSAIAEVTGNYALLNAANRSSSQLVPTGSMIRAAYLYWMASQSDSSAVNADKQVTFLVNGAASSVTAGRVWTGDNSGGGSMGAMADVTALIPNVAIANSTMRMDGLDIQINGSQCGNSTVHGSWGLYIVYENLGLSTRLISFYDGLEYIGGTAGIPSKSIPAAGFTVPNASGIDRVSKVSIIIADGDDAGTGDSLSLKSNLNASATAISTSNRPATNFFRGLVSSVTENGTETSQVGSTNTTASDTGGLDVATVISPTSVIPAGTSTITATLDSASGELLIAHSMVLMANTSDSNVRIIKALEGSATTVVTGDTLKYVLTVDNRQGVYEALNVVPTDTLPKGLTYGGTEISYNGGTTWATLSGVTTSTNGTTGVTTITMPAIRRIDNDGKVWGGTNAIATQLGTQDVKYRIAVTADGNAFGSLINTASVTNGSFEIGANQADNTSSVPVTINQKVDLVITKTDGASSVVSGKATTYTIRVTNNGPSSVMGAVVKDPRVTGLNQTATACTLASSKTCVTTTAPTIAALEGSGVTLPTIASGAFYEFTVTATVTAASGSVTNIATVTVPTGFTDPTSVNGVNSVSDTDTVTPLPTLQVRKISNGGTGTFAFTGTNGFVSDSITTVTAGTAQAGTVKTLTAAGVVTTITETPLAGFTMTNVSCMGGGTVSPDYAAGTFTLDTIATAAGSTLVCTVTNSTAPPVVTLLKLGRNIGPSPVLTTGQLPPANTTAAFVDGSVVIAAKPGDRVEYCIVYTNTGGLAPNFVLTDNVPIIMDALLNAYGPAGEPVATQKGIYWADGKVLIANATAVPDGGVNLTSVSDTDKGTLATTGGLGKGTMTLNLGPAPAGLAAGGQGTVCFQTKVP